MKVNSCSAEQKVSRLREIVLWRALSLVLYLKEGFHKKRVEGANSAVSRIINSEVSEEENCKSPFFRSNDIIKIINDHTFD